MKLLEQCQIWNENSEFQKIIDAIEAVQLEERTPELDSELARAYNNIADVDDREIFEKAVELLKPHEEYFEGDHCWNFRIAYAYFYLNRESDALRHFKKALEARPGDEDTEEFIKYCIRSISLPSFDKNFRERTQDAWKAFEEIEAEIRADIDENSKCGNAMEYGETLLAKLNKALNIAFDGIAFELGVGAGTYELVLTPEGDKIRLFELDYFARRAPESVRDNWVISVGRRGNVNIELRAAENSINGDDIQMWIEKNGEKTVDIAVYCEKLTPLLKEDEGKAWWMLTSITDVIIGEISAMAYIGNFEVLDAPKAEPWIKLKELPKVLERMGLDVQLEASEYLNSSYHGYTREPDNDQDAIWRADIYTGSTRLPQALYEYFQGTTDASDALNSDGAVLGFICYPLDSFYGEHYSEDILNFRDTLEKEILETASDDAVTFIGGATGTHSGYLDFIAWDLPSVLDAASTALVKHSFTRALFHVFRADAMAFPLIRNSESEDDEDSEEVKSSPEYYDEDEFETVEEYIKEYFGEFQNVFHELVSPDIHVDVCMIPPAEDRDYITLVTMGMGAHRMDVPDELDEYDLYRAELAIAVPTYWKLDEESLKDEKWYWPIRLLKGLARLPISNGTWLGWGHTVDNRTVFAENTELTSSMLVDKIGITENDEPCILPNGEEVNFYQVIPLYKEEMDYKLSEGADALIKKIRECEISFVVDPKRENVLKDVRG